MAEEERIIKIRCPHCDGKIAIDQNFYQELEGKPIDCPHCNDKMAIPLLASVGDVTRPGAGRHSLDTTQKIQLPPLDAPPPTRTRQPQPQTRHCPHCRVEVGLRDRICIVCGKKIPPPAQPPGFAGR
jgi:hypothetical protein